MITLTPKESKQVQDICDSFLPFNPSSSQMAGVLFRLSLVRIAKNPKQLLDEEIRKNPRVSRVAIDG